MSSFFFVSAIGFSRLSMLFLAIPGDCIWYSLRLLRCFWYGDADDDGEWLHNTHKHTHGWCCVEGGSRQTQRLVWAPRYHPSDGGMMPSIVGHTAIAASGDG